MLKPDVSVAEDLCAFIDASPSPYHAADTAAQRLVDQGAVELFEDKVWPAGAGDFFMRRAGSLIAWRVGAKQNANGGFRIVGAHTDSPNLRIKPNPDTSTAGFAQVGVEIYGGVLRNSWLDRDLGLSGRIAVRRSRGVETKLVRVDDPVFRVPQLAIHLDRGINDKGLKLNAQNHMAPVWASDPAGSFVDWLAKQAKIKKSSDIMGWDLMMHDLTPSGLLGADESFIAAPRIDNLASCHSAVRALNASPAGDHVPVICLFDHEEVGSVSSTGAGSSMVPMVLERIHTALGGDRAGFPVSLSNSMCISADGAHATHPNYADRHEPNHQITLNGGPVIKKHSNQRYATDAVGTALAAQLCEDAKVPYQHFVTRTDLACGSTIGPVTAARLGITTIDMGMPQLSMHSAREMGGAHDPGYFAAALTAFLSS